MKDHKDLAVAIMSYRSWFDLEEIDDSGVHFTTRLNGNVATGRRGDRDLQEAFRIQEQIEEAFPNVEVDVEVCDEWVNLVGSLKPIVYVDFFNKDRRFAQDRKEFLTYDAAWDWAKNNIINPSPDMIHYY